MAKIETRNWKEFRLDKIFRMNNTKSIVQKDIVPDSGSIPYVTAQAGNNGVMTYIDCPPDWTDEGNCIMIGGKTLTFSYQPEDFCSNDSHNIALYLKEEDKATETHYLFLITALRKSLSQKYTWSDSISMKTIKDDLIMLPVDKDGHLDWMYMNDYMSSVMRESKASLENLGKVKKEHRPVDSSDWKQFSISSLFKVEKGTRLTRASMIEGDTPFIGASLENNGITARVGNTDHIHHGGLITVAYNGHATGTAFYQPDSFWASDDVNVLYPKFPLTENIALFLVPLICEAGRPYSYGDKWGKEIMENDCLTLPVSKSGDPDWAYMDEYIRTMMERTKFDLSAMKQIK